MEGCQFGLGEAVDAGWDSEVIEFGNCWAGKGSDDRVVVGGNDVCDDVRVELGEDEGWCGE